jgi:hypothetical protein
VKLVVEVDVRLSLNRGQTRERVDALFEDTVNLKTDLTAVRVLPTIPNHLVKMNDIIIT